LIFEEIPEGLMDNLLDLRLDRVRGSAEVLQHEVLVDGNLVSQVHVGQAFGRVHHLAQGHHLAAVGRGILESRHEESPSRTRRAVVRPRAATLQRTRRRLRSGSGRRRRRRGRALLGHFDADIGLQVQNVGHFWHKGAPILLRKKTPTRGSLGEKVSFMFQILFLTPTEDKWLAKALIASIHNTRLQ